MSHSDTNLNVKENKMKTKGAQSTPPVVRQHEEVQIKHEDTSAVVMEGTDLFDDNDEDIQYEEEEETQEYQDIYHIQDHQVGTDGAGSQGSRSHLSIF